MDLSFRVRDKSGIEGTSRRKFSHSSAHDVPNGPDECKLGAVPRQKENPAPSFERVVRL